MPTAEVLLEEVTLLRQENVLLKEQIAWLKKQLFGGGKSERMDAAQLLLKLEALEQQLASQTPTQQVTYERKKPQAGKHEAPAERFKDLPVEETIVVEPDEVQAAPHNFEQISTEETFEVDIHPPRLFKRKIVRPKYRSKAQPDQPPVVAPAPKRPITGSYVAAGLLAWIVLQKYVQHMPLYRQEKASAHWGAQLSRKTMSDWVESVAEWLKPIYNYMRKELLESGYMQADETPVKFIDPDIKKGKSGQGWLWAISRPGGNVVFDWRLTRRHGELTSLLDGYKGLLQSDAYGAYQDYGKNDGVILLGCMAHARRKFHNALQSAPRESALVLRLIGKLYAHEETSRQAQHNPAQRNELRQDEHRRLHKWLRIVIKISARRALPRSALGQACAYALKHWDALTRYLDHPEAEIDNNLIENAIRPSALGKKNFLFIGHPGAGQKSAIIYSIVVSCQRHGIDPLAYIKDVLTRLPTMTNQNDLRPLLPSNWQPQGD